MTQTAWTSLSHDSRTNYNVFDIESEDGRATVRKGDYLSMPPGKRIKPTSSNTGVGGFDFYPDGWNLMRAANSLVIAKIIPHGQMYRKIGASASYGFATACEYLWVGSEYEDKIALRRELVKVNLWYADIIIGKLDEKCKLVAEEYIQHLRQWVDAETQHERTKILTRADVLRAELNTKLWSKLWSSLSRSWSDAKNPNRIAWELTNIYMLGSDQLPAREFLYLCRRAPGHAPQSEVEARFDEAVNRAAASRGAP